MNQRKGQGIFSAEKAAGHIFPNDTKVPSAPPLGQVGNLEVPNECLVFKVDRRDGSNTRSSHRTETITGQVESAESSGGG